MARPTLADLTRDPASANAGTARGRACLADSVETYGWGRPIVADRHLRVLGGNHTLDEAKRRGAPILVIPLTGDELLVHQRTDLHLATDALARGLAYADNRTGELNRSWHEAQLQADRLAGVDLGAVGFDDEFLSRLEPERGGAGLDPMAAPLGDSQTMPAADSGAPDLMKEAPPPAPIVSLTWTAPLPTPAAQVRWEAWLRLLGDRYPDTPCPGTRLIRVLAEVAC